MNNIEHQNKSNLDLTLSGSNPKVLDIKEIIEVRVNIPELLPEEKTLKEDNGQKNVKPNNGQQTPQQEMIDFEQPGVYGDVFVSHNAQNTCLPLDINPHFLMEIL